MDRAKRSLRRQTAVYLTEDERAQLEQLARREQRSISFYLRQIILEHLRRTSKRTDRESAKA